MARVDDAASEERMTANHVKLFVGGIPLGNSRVAFIGVPKNMLSGAPCGFTYVQFTRDVVVAVALAIALVAGFLLHPSAEAGSLSLDQPLMDVAVVVVGVGCVIGGEMEETEGETATARGDDAASEERMAANHVKLFVGGIPLGNSRVAFVGVPKNRLSGAPRGFTYVQFTRDVVVAVALAIALVAGFLLHPSAEAAKGYL
ncbi:hypothetical protein GUJ93_ZPchr0006g43761 [Zizania palustris]|uniref:Uncharacterized protein n=1 Tax=Zizania palustris TaxID=103762 RepID=A0A8J5TC64_ZIZPA|nr:hypothetical protein GUJ93_ZPchr0006g43761 [Zizania palustris]